ncbi:MAG: 3-dehydroquinate synthase [Tidjanibacter sp.]|nr:3-dehydroquinate synthase [Tidjanibacter sp.]
MNTLCELKFSSERATRIVVGSVAKDLRELLPEGRVITIVDAEVDAHHNLSESLPESILIPGGEENKNLELAEMLWKELVDSKADRDTFLLAVGGGVVMDLVGFVASTFMRGLRFGFVPTTLLGQIDAAIGGKCAVNLGGYKNMVGLFSPADFVLCDVGLLSTLPDREFRSGVAEMIKSAIVGDSELFELLENGDLATLKNDHDLLGRMMQMSVNVKCKVVAADPYEKGLRRVLNLGHTLAHAVESLTTEYTHGEAVAVGLVWAARLAAERGLLALEDAERVVRVVEKYGLPTSVQIAQEELLEAMTHDKKCDSEGVKIVLPEAIGKCGIYRL